MEPYELPWTTVNYCELLWIPKNFYEFLAAPKKFAELQRTSSNFMNPYWAHTSTCEYLCRNHFEHSCWISLNPQHATPLPPKKPHREVPTLFLQYPELKTLQERCGRGEEESKKSFQNFLEYLECTEKNNFSHRSFLFYDIAYIYDTRPLVDSTDLRTHPSSFFSVYCT